MFGEVKDEGGDTIQVQKAIDFYVSNISSVPIDTEEKNWYIYSKDNLLRFLDDGYVVLAGRGYYSDINDFNSLEFGPNILVYGYVTIGSEYRFMVRDPSPLNEGSSYMMSYEKLCSGRNHQGDEEMDEGVWQSSVVVNTSYDENVLKYYFYNQHFGG